MLKPNKHINALRKIALSLPEAEEGSSCNKLSFKAGKKAFLYLGEDDESYNLMIKLPHSFGEAEKLARKSPDIYRPGSSGWVKCVFPTKKAPAGLIDRWIEESYRALVPKKLVERLGEANVKPRAAKKSASKKAAKKKSAAKKAARKRA